MPVAGHTLHGTPRLPLLIGAGVLAFTLAVIGSATRPGGHPETGVPLLARDLLFEDRADGAVVVRDARDRTTVAVLEPATNGFIRGSLRALSRDRRAEESAPLIPYRVAAWPDGRVTLDDPFTGRQLDLDAFGATNSAAFARLLTARGDTP